MGYASGTDLSPARAIVWNYQNSQWVIQDLNDLIPSNSGWVLLMARAINDQEQIVGYGTKDGQTRGFILSPACSTPMAPTLSSPADGSSGHTETPELSWNAVAGATSYNIQICNDSACNSVVLTHTGKNVSPWTVSPALSQGKYWWRVLSNNECGAGPYSGTRSFTVGAPVETTSVPMQVFINNSFYADPAWGMVQGATNNYEQGIDQIAFPASPDGDDVYFVSISGQGFPYDKLLKDYRGITQETTLWKLILKVAPGKVMKLTWNPQDLLADWNYSWQKANSSWVATDGPHNLKDTPQEILLDNTQGDNALTQRYLLKAYKGFPLSLKAGGWNLISLPIDPTDMNPATLFGANLIAIYEWNAVGKLYAVPTAVKSKTGFWVAVSQDTDLEIAGTAPADSHVPVVIGWNLVGPVGNQPVPTGPTILAVYGWGWPPDYRYVVPDSCEEGKGYWIAVSQDGDIW